MDTRSNVSHYRITEDGIKTLSFFQKDLSPEIKQEVREYLKSTGFKAQERIVTPADYYITKQGTYSVRCQLIEKGNSLIDLNIAAPNLEAAQSNLQKMVHTLPGNIRKNNGGAFIKLFLFIS